MPRASLLIRLPAALLLIGALAVPGSATAAGATRCAQAVINDGLDERLDKTYPMHCYREALHSLPEDILDYTGLRDLIVSAMQASVLGKSEAIRGLQSLPSGSGATGSQPSRTTVTPSQGKRNDKPPKALFKRAVDKLGPSDADSVPIPLLVLGGLALLMIAVGATGVATRKLKARRLAPPPHSETL